MNGGVLFGIGGGGGGGGGRRGTGGREDEGEGWVQAGVNDACGECVWRIRRAECEDKLFREAKTFERGERPGE